MESLAYLQLIQAYEESEASQYNTFTFKPSCLPFLLFSILSGGFSLTIAETAVASAYYDVYLKDYAGGGFFYIFDHSVPSQVVFVPIAPVIHPLAVKRVDAHSTPTSAPSHTCKVLRPGDSGEEVRCLQEQLQRLGYFHGSITGYYGSVTQAAVIAFQKDYGLHVDGVAGPQTLARLSDLAGR